MLRAIFTLDYEIHGNGEGDPAALMVEPSARLMDQFERYGAKLTIMADVAEILKFREYKQNTGRDAYYYGAIANQLRNAVRRGHDVQLHLHASYCNARNAEGRWVQDWSEYNFAGLPFERMNELIRTGKRYLEDLLRPVSAAYKCHAFRAANWAVSPSRNVVRALLQNDIQIETSVFKYGRREGIVSFDYANAHSDLVPWPVDENDVCRKDEAGQLVEFPIYCESRWIGAFLTRNRIYRALQSRAHRVADASGGYSVPSKGNSRAARVVRSLSWLTRNHAWKADFNQCTGRQLVGALKRAEARYAWLSSDLPFVLIGHSKLFTADNERSLRPFLEFVAGEKSRFGFGTFGDFKPVVLSPARQVALAS
ncbi:MAG TPA: hypothetical protein P5205_06665 [Candidatus Paceibacterota bacterium]|nr:hypothetical protein [Verrucomicrobiota bacterium]HSA10038.1 hypothetical protein [Candidatus Paceibacterota bacterium]